MISRLAQRKNRRRRVRAKINGSAERPRLAVFRSTRSISAQLIDDTKGVTVAVASSNELSVADRKKTKTKQATAVGALLAKRAKDASIASVVFDRAGYRYHGRVRALAESARSGGLQF